MAMILTAQFLLLLLLSTAADAQNHHYSSFTYTQVSTNRYATPLPSPLACKTAYAPAFSEASRLLPDNITYTTWSLNPEATATPDGLYGQSAYAKMWEDLSYSSTVPFTTTVSPTPVPKSELVYPPPLYNAPTTTNVPKLPSNFIWGVAGSAWQIEGGLMVEGRGPSSLDVLGSLPNPAGLNDSVTADMNYFLYKQDIVRLAAIGIPYYSFSIEWSRVVPFYYAGTPANKQALDHYEDLINTCLEHGLTPVVTLNHITTPIEANPADQDTFIDAFMYYAKLVVTRYANRIPIWITFNEPNILIGTQNYNAFTTFLLAHAQFYHWYKDNLRGRGQVSMKLANNLAVPLDLHNSADVEAAQRYQEFILQIMGNPVFLGKQFPESVLSTPGINLVPLTGEQISLIHGTCDFLSLDPYVAQLSTPAGGDLVHCISNNSNPLWPQCVETTSVQANGWLIGRSSQTYPLIAPQYVRQQLGYVWNTFKPAGVLISEFGYPEYAESEKLVDEQLFDLDRSLYYQDFMNEVLKAVYFDDINVIGALAWSFVDNNEFGSFSSQFGMQTVNRTDMRFGRRYKRSMFDYVDLFSRIVGRH